MSTQTITNVGTVILLLLSALRLRRILTKNIVPAKRPEDLPGHAPLPNTFRMPQLKQFLTCHEN